MRFINVVCAQFPKINARMILKIFFSFILADTFIHQKVAYGNTVHFNNFLLYKSVFDDGF